VNVTADNSTVYDAIRAMIAAGEFRAGEPLRELRLAQRTGVSRTPVREALRRLAAEGIVELRPNKGAQLVEISKEDTAAIFDVRCLLEPYAAARAATRATEEHLAELEVLLDSMDRVVSSGRDRLDELAPLNNQFHSAILAAADARLAAEALAVVMRGPLVQRTFHLYSDEQLIRSQQHHREILAALRAKNAVWAESVMRSHIEAARSIYG
jgi:DNA-binding GntR family transcriptional regulator